MFFKIKKFIFLIFLIFLQSCSGSKVGRFLETSFGDLENIKTVEDSKNKINSKQIVSLEKKENNTQSFKDINKVEKSKNKIRNNPSFNSEKKPDYIKRTNKVRKASKKRKVELQSYKIILILKNVDPKDPIEQLSTILRNSEVNFEIEKIERFFDSKNKNINTKN